MRTFFAIARCTEFQAIVRSGFQPLQDLHGIVGVARAFRSDEKASNDRSHCSKPVGANLRMSNNIHSHNPYKGDNPPIGNDIIFGIENSDCKLSSRTAAMHQEELCDPRCQHRSCIGR